MKANKITPKEAQELLKKDDGKQFFTVTFVKRTTGEIRTMNCRKGVVKGQVGGELRYSPSKKNLISVYDVKKCQYRMIALENIKQIKIRNKTYNVETI